ncbi:MAG: hypothetical protein IPM54_06125 [Polyangiaceae bacterium]|nr:hypothetical protein [Polyangiaceae bacterium]
MITKAHDLLGKTLVSGLFELHGETLVEVEIPPMDAKRFDVWYVPDEVKQRDAPRFGGVLAEIALTPAVIEIWSDRVDEREFHDSYGKRHAWWGILEERAKAVCRRPSLWHLTVGRPNLVLHRFGFQPIAGSSGHYKTMHPGWQVDLVVIRELAKTRETLLLRLLGDERLCEEALRELDALPEDAWEKGLAKSWVKRVQLQLPSPTSPAPATTGSLIMNMLEWYREIEKKERAELTQQVTQQVTQRVTRRVTQQFMQERVRLFELRLGRALTATERKTLVQRIRNLGADQVMPMVIERTPAELEAWLERPQTT